jgi:hypothetical protein
MLRRPGILADSLLRAGKSARNRAQIKSLASLVEASSKRNFPTNRKIWTPLCLV